MITMLPVRLETLCQFPLFGSQDGIYLRLGLHPDDCQFRFEWGWL